MEETQVKQPPIRAAQYVRMSTEHQQYSTDNQKDTIRTFAAKHGMEIVRTYADDGKSGLNIEGRESLQRLLNDIQSGNADFSVILVYDVSRFGRFQNTDQAAYYEYVCNMANIRIEYCAVRTSAWKCHKSSGLKLFFPPFLPIFFIYSFIFSFIR